MNLVILADVSQELDERKIVAGWVGLFLLLAMIVVLVLLFMSFAKHVRKAREPWEGEDDPAALAEGEERARNDDEPPTAPN